MKKRNATIDYLRGFAAVMVCFCHYRHALPDVLAGIAKHGELGVQIFFVISGFIIPYSMERSGYQLRDIGRFWLKRLLRLQPTFVIALLITFALSQVSAHLKRGAADFSLTELASAIFYLRIPGENPVIWTLVVELKYYLFISILFPLFFSRTDAVRRLTFFSAGLLTALLASRVETVKHLPFFLLGFAGCYLRTGRAGTREAALLAVFALVAAVPQSSPLQICAGVGTTLAILYLPHFEWRTGLFFGSISYSLYLIHFPLGVKIVNLTLPHLPDGLHWIMLPVTTMICSAVAYALFKLVEEPSSKWSQQVELSKNKNQPQPALVASGS